MMPKLYEILGYQISIWSNENYEPIHIHISKYKPSANSPKVWITSKGEFLPTERCKQVIPDHILNSILSKLRPNIPQIIGFWEKYHGYIKYYK